MGIASSVLHRLAPAPHKAAHGLLGQLVKGVRQDYNALNTAGDAAYTYSGAKDFVHGAVTGVQHPIRRLKGEDAPIVYINGKPVRMMTGEVPMGPGGALKGAVEQMLEKTAAKGALSRKMDQIALERATPERIHEAKAAVTDAGVHGEHYGELHVGSRHDAPGQELGDLMRAHPKAVIHKVPEEHRLGAAPGSPRETFIIDKDGTLHMSAKGEFHGVHHPDLMASAGMIGKDWESNGLPQFLVKDRNIIQGEINHSKPMHGAEHDKVSLQGWGNTKMNPAQERTMHEVVTAATKKGINVRSPFNARYGGH